MFQQCYTEQVVTTSGNIIYNSGCLSKSRCSTVATSLVGRRSITNMVDKRSSDLVTCTECCTDDFCNMKGCGTQGVPAEQRGPYCYTCDALDPKDCTDVDVCSKNELCIMYNPGEFHGLPETIYRGQCETRAACDAIAHAFSNHRCAPMCCNTDFCNDHCGTPQNFPMTTPQPGTTNGNTEMSTSKTHLSNTFQCNIRNGFVHLHNAQAQLCVYIAVQHKHSWNGAQTICESQGWNLVVLDTRDKALLLSHELESQSKYNHEFYWIGAKDFLKNNHFSWVNGHALLKSEANWGSTEPDHYHHGEDQDCVSMFRDSRPPFLWHDRNCDDRGYYICERK
ncbi:macrophage mannose receptor 1-like [Mercenaria mercenaria]|uniref:macrophage mannose receptor 1-like n=1 Tax=Mercenaria mercenaria TaxID=6596 RepID=UPI00234F3855|nr:macrophage mannose receptor 1-like [Mercenaria mercenaria]